MKFCENCGAKLEDGAKFCEECGSHIEVASTETFNIEQPATPSIIQDNQNNSEAKHTISVVENEAPKLSEICIPAKKEMKDWIVILILILCSSLIIGTSFISTIMQIIALVIMWRKPSWSFGVKIGVTIAYVILYLI